MEPRDVLTDPAVQWLETASDEELLGHFWGPPLRLYTIKADHERPCICEPSDPVGQFAAVGVAAATVAAEVKRVVEGLRRVGTR